MAPSSCLTITTTSTHHSIDASHHIVFEDGSSTLWLQELLTPPPENSFKIIY